MTKKNRSKASKVKAEAKKPAVQRELLNINDLKALQFFMNDLQLKGRQQAMTYCNLVLKIDRIIESETKP